MKNHFFIFIRAKKQTEFVPYLFEGMIQILEDLDVPLLSHRGYQRQSEFMFCFESEKLNLDLVSEVVDKATSIYFDDLKDVAIEIRAGN